MPKNHICQCCGKTYEKKLIPEVYEGQNCYDCSFWLRKVNYPPYVANRRAIINHHHYMVYAEIDGILKGSGGRQFIVQFHDGRVIRSNNVWEQGLIPARFREMLPDNAVFLPVEEPPVTTINNSGIPF